MTDTDSTAAAATRRATEPGDAFEIGEPVTCARCQAAVRTVERYGGVEVYHNGIVSGYVNDEVARIGGGDWSVGVLLIARGSMEGPCPLGGELKPYATSREEQR